MGKSIKNIAFYSSSRARSIGSIVSSRLKVSNNKLKGFTLLEILIASSIFAIIMVITTGVVAQSSSYRSKLKAMREVSEETRRLADMITRDIREADGEIKININTSATPNVIKTYKNGVALINYNNQNSMSSMFNTAPSEVVSEEPGSRTASFAQCLVLASKDKYKVYLVARWTNRVYYKTYDRFDASGLVILTPPMIHSTKQDADSNNVRINGISSWNNETRISFGGLVPDVESTSVKQQPYVSFLITSKATERINSEDLSNIGTGEVLDSTYEGVGVTDRAKTQIRSLVTLRNYQK